MWQVSRIIGYAVVGSATIGTGVSLNANEWDVNSLGIVRLGRAAFTVFQIGMVYNKSLYSKEWDTKSPEYKQLKSETHTVAAEKLLKLICKNRGVYIKVGQHIGALDYLLPTEYVNTMKILHSKAPTNSIEDIYKVIRQDLKKDPNELFESFDTEPLGTASLAQVHRATLKTGEQVAVKVQHPYVKGNSIVDMKTMEVLCKIMALIFPEFKMQWLVEESKKNLPIELDFANEGKNAEKAAAMFKDYKWLKVPSICWELTTPRVLTMQYLEGGQVNDLEYIQRNKIDPFEISSKLGKLYSQMIFINGFVHSDPHPGNILVKKNDSGSTDLVLLDHGLYANLTDNFRYEYSKLWMSILRVDQPAMRIHSMNLGIQGNLYALFACMLTGRPWTSVVAGIDKKKFTSDEKETMKEHSTLVLPQIADILAQVDRQMLLILKTNDLIRGIETTLKTHNRRTAFWVMSKCCVKSVFNVDKYKSEKGLTRFRLRLSEQWAIFKLNLYYLYLGLCNFTLLSTIKQIV